MIVLSLAPIAFLVVAVLIGAETPGYSQMHDSISKLALTSNGNWQTANFVIGGVLVVMLGWVLSRIRVDLAGRRYVAGAIGFFGVVMILSAVFETDRNGIKTAHGAIHVLLFVAGIAALLTAQFRIAVREGLSTMFGLYTSITLLIGLGTFSAIIVVYHWQGIAQRVLLGVVFVWVAATARRYLNAPQPLVTSDQVQCRECLLGEWRRRGVGR